jgi:glycosyltransferase involved in cell wall biosynthesis
MKILNVVSSIDNVTGGGFVERTVQMSHALINYGYECSILTTNFNLSDERVKNLSPIKLVVLPLINRKYFIPSLSINTVKKAVQNADIIHLMGLWSPLNCIVFFYAQKLKIPYVICPAGTLKIYGRSLLLKRIYKFMIGNRILEKAMALIAVSSLELIDFKNYGFSENQVNIIPNGINESDFVDKNDVEFREIYSIGNSPYILFIGRMNHFKGPDLLLEAFIKLKNKFQKLHLVLAGPDEIMHETLKLKTLVQKNKLELRVHFINYLGKKEKSQALHGCKFLVIPSRHDAMSIVVLEAGIVSKPVLITEQAGFSIIAKINGGVVCQAEIASLSKEISNLLAMSQKELNKMGDNLYCFVKKNYTWKVIVKKFIYLFNNSKIKN